MLRNYLRITVRSLFKHKSQSLIKLFGLTLGLAGALLILAFIRYEFSFDGFHDSADDIYRVTSTRTTSGTPQNTALALAPVGPTLVEDYPEVLDSVRVAPTVKRIFRYKDRNFFQEGVFYVDRTIFDVFSFELIEGDPTTALEVPFTMVVTESTARKYFGDRDPIGEIINWDNRFDYKVTGVVKDPPANSHFTFEALASFSTYIKYDARIGSWQGGSFRTYILLRENADIDGFIRKLRDFDGKYHDPLFEGTGTTVRTSIQPLKSIHLRSRLQGELGVNGDIRMIYVFAAVALLIILVACINFMNLSTARAANRTREVGLRKVLGADRKKIIIQFLGESLLFTALSSILAFMAARVLLPSFRVVADREIPVSALNEPSLIGGLAAIVLLVGLTAGSYPAFYLSSFRPTEILRGRLTRGPKRSRFRSLLVIFQFTVSIVLIIGTLIISGQQRFMMSKDLGFDKENILVIPIHNEEVRLKLESLKTELLRSNGVVSAGSSSMVPGEMYIFNIGTIPEGFPSDQPFLMDNFLVDDDFLEALEIEIVRGRGFSSTFATDAADAVMINETAARELGWTDPIGKKIILTNAAPPHKQERTVIGVFKDIHQRSLYSRIAPTVIEHISDEGPIEYRARRLALRLDPGNYQATLAEIEDTWNAFFTENPFYSFFLDDYFINLHVAEARLSRLFLIFAAMAVLIGCVGLFGLAAYMAERRTKEIGIRKVLGSSAGRIVLLLCREFLGLVVIANVVAWPAAYFAGVRWLRNFPYAADLRIATFLLTGGLALAIALLTVGYRALKSALANPVDCLRYE